MLQGGEDPRFITRRLVILASEDIGLANSHALMVAVAAQRPVSGLACRSVNTRLHAVLYLSTSPKSNSVTRALGAVKRALREQPVQAVPPWLRDAHNATSQSLGNGQGYRYSHDYPQAISGQDYMLEPQRFYVPGVAGRRPAARSAWRNCRR